MPVYVGNGAWGSGTGVPLTQPQFDGNTYEFDTRITALETNPPEANGIASITATGLAWTVTLTDGQTNTLPIPLPLPHWRDEWAPLTLYVALDQFAVTGEGVFAVLVDHVSAATFDPDAVAAAETAGAFAIGRTYIIATVGTTDFTLIGASSNTVGVEFRATGVGSGTGTATPKLYRQLIGADSNTNFADLADVTISAIAANDFAVWTVSGSPAAGAWQNRSPTEVTALLDVFAGDTGSPGGGVKGLVPAPADGDAAAGKVLGADGTWVTASTVGTLDDLIDVDTSGAVAGDVLRASGSPLVWGPDTLGLDDLNDVGLPSPAEGDFLRYDGGSPNGWTNSAGLAASDLDAATLPLDAMSLLVISEPQGSPDVFESRQTTIADLLASGDITLGSTAVALGSTVTTITGLTLSGGTLSGNTTLPGSGQISSAGWFGLGGTPGAQFHIVGNILAPAWTTNGIRYRTGNTTITDSTSSGTVSSVYIDRFGQPTLAASNVTTFTTAAAVVITGEPLAGTNVTITNPLSLFVPSGKVRFDSMLIFNGASASFPALKRNGATLEVRTASDSAYAALQSSKITVGDAAALVTTSVAMNNGAAAASGTLTNAPAAGNPTKWIPISDNGTTRYIPAW